MTDPNFTLLYVADPARSAAFYAGLLGKPPVEQSPRFAMFALASGASLGLWAAEDVAPPATAAGGSEIAFAVESAEAVEAMYRDWTARGLQTIQPPTSMDFGTTFVAVDPDGHRLRVFAPHPG